MGASTSRIATTLALIGRDVMSVLRDVPEDVLNQPVELPEANSLFAIATHLVGSGEFWVLACVGGRTIHRDREAEFRATGTREELFRRYERWLTDVGEVLEGLDEAGLARPTAAPVYRPDLGTSALTVLDCLLHAVEHSALHLGHIQLTHQLLLDNPAA